MSKRALILLGLIGLIIIFLLCAMKHWRNIEMDIAKCSSDILTKSNYSTLKVDTHDKGRTVFVSGNVVSEVDKQRVLSLLNDKCNMTGLESDIKVVIPKPTITPSLNFSFDNENKLVNVFGKVSKSTDSNGLIGLFYSYPKATNFSKGVVNDKDVIPASYFKYTSTLLPIISKVTQANVKYKGNEITLRGNVPNNLLKQKIGNRLASELGSKVKLLNLLTITEPVITIKALEAKDCQLELSGLLKNSMINFNTGSSVISQDSTELLNKLAITTKSCQNVKVEIVGHTDKTGNEQNNIKLSHARASSVVKYLLKAGVQVKKLSAKGVGSSMPITTNETAEGRSQNRRIEFKVHSL